MNKNIHEYILGNCPNCNSSNGEETFFEETNGSIIKQVFCHNCKKTIQIIYLIEKVEILQEPISI